jgi:hypothetical protein
MSGEVSTKGASAFAVDGKAAAVWLLAPAAAAACSSCASPFCHGAGMLGKMCPELLGRVSMSRRYKKGTLTSSAALCWAGRALQLGTLVELGLQLVCCRRDLRCLHSSSTQDRWSSVGLLSAPHEAKGAGSPALDDSCLLLMLLLGPP